MGLTRSMLKGMGLTEEQVSAIIEAHIDTVDALKEEREKYKEKAIKSKELEAELSNLKKDGGNWQEKYEKEHSDFESYKNERELLDKKNKIKSAYRSLLLESGIDDKRLSAILKVTNLEDIKLDSQGKIKNSDTLKDEIKKEWSDFIVSTSVQGAGTENPPHNSGGKVTKKDEIYKKDDSGRYIHSAAERQKMIAENIEAESTII